MNTPLAAAVESYLSKNPARFHMPGHKGGTLYPVGAAAAYDITEVEGADSLYQAAGAIARCEEWYARLYGAQASLLSAGGSTLCIQTMLALACPPGSRVLAARGVHTAAVGAMALLDLHPVWLWPRGDGPAGLMNPVSPEQVETALKEHADVSAVYLTSPNYFGLLSDIGSIASICKGRGIPLLVDNAHGAHLRFLRRPLHPIGLGADLCCDSLHKTLPALTGAAVLHVGNPSYGEEAKGRMALFGSTSPSYLILLSADGALDYLEHRAAADLERVAGRIAGLEKAARSRGFALLDGPRDPARLTAGFAAAGWDRESFGRHLRESGVEPEYVGGEFAVFLAAGENASQDYMRLERALLPGPHKTIPPTAQRDIPAPEQAISLREAVFAPRERIETERAAGRVAGGVLAPCPPGIPLAIPGERLSPELAHSLKNAGIFHVDVVR